MPNYLARIVSAGARTIAQATPPRAAPPLLPAAGPSAAFVPEAAGRLPPTVAVASPASSATGRSEPGAPPASPAAVSPDPAAVAPRAEAAAPRPAPHEIAQPQRQGPAEHDAAPAIQAPRALRPDVARGGMPRAEQLDRSRLGSPPSPPANAADQPHTIGTGRERSERELVASITLPPVASAGPSAAPGPRRAGPRAGQDAQPRPQASA